MAKKNDNRTNPVILIIIYACLLFVMYNTELYHTVAVGEKVHGHGGQICTAPWRFPATDKPIPYRIKGLFIYCEWKEYAAL